MNKICPLVSGPCIKKECIFYRTWQEEDEKYFLITSKIPWKLRWHRIEWKINYLVDKSPPLSIRFEDYVYDRIHTEEFFGSISYYYVYSKTITHWRCALTHDKEVTLGDEVYGD
jgi:hypothetical protein